MDKLVAIFGVFVAACLMIFIFAALFAFVTQWAWAGTMVPLFHFPELSLFQAWQMNILGGMLCRGFSTSASSK